MATPIKQIKTSDDVIHSIQATGILYGELDSTSTSTNFTAQIPGVDEYYDGLTVLLKNGVVTSATNYVVNINGLGGKPTYSNMATGYGTTNPTRDSTVFNVNYTMLLTYSSSIVDGGGWIMYRGYDSNTNTIGYQLRTNSQTMPVATAMYRYRMLFTSADGKHYVPSNASSSTSETASKTVTTTPIDPFGSIFYYGRTNTVSSGSKPSATYLWEQYNFALGYAFNRTGATLTMTTSAPVYLKCAPQANGSAIIDATTPIVQALPTTEDGKIYIFLGIATSATAIELEINHPVYYYKDGAIREWTNQAAPDITGLAPLASPSFTGTPTAPTPSSTAGNTTIVNKGYVTDAITTAISGVTQFDYAVTSTLPTTGVKGTIYLVGHTHGTQDIYDEYIYANNAWEKIGNTDINLDDYATKTFVTTTLVNDGIKVIDLGEQPIPIGSGIGQLTVSSDVSSEIDNDFQNKNLALRIHHTADMDTPNAHVIVFNIGNIEYNNMNFHGFQGSFTLSDLKTYECFVGIGYGANAGVNLIGVARQFDDRATMSDNSNGYHGVSLMNDEQDSYISSLFNGDLNYDVHQFNSVLVYDIGDIPLTSAELTSLSSGDTISKTISIDNEVWNNIISLHYNPGVALTSHITLNNVELSKYSLLNEGTLNNGNKQFSGVVAINGSSMVFTLLTIDINDNTQNSLIIKPIPSVGDMETALGNYLTASDISITTNSANTGASIATITVGSQPTELKAPAQVQVNWNATSGISSILNKPTIPTAASFTSTYDSRYKKVQTAVTGNPTVSGTTDTFVTNVTQDAQGVLTRTAAKIAWPASYTPTSHTHNVSTDTFVKSYPGATTRIYPAANVTAVTGITSSAATIISTVSGTTFGISVSNGILEIGSTVGISSITSTTTTAVTSVSASGSSSVRGTSVTVMTGLGTASTATAITSINS